MTRGSGTYGAEQFLVSDPPPGLTGLGGNTLSSSLWDGLSWHSPATRVSSPPCFPLRLGANSDCFLWYHLSTHTLSRPTPTHPAHQAPATPTSLAAPETFQPLLCLRTSFRTCCSLCPECFFLGWLLVILQSEGFLTTIPSVSPNITCLFPQWHLAQSIT